MPSSPSDPNQTVDESAAPSGGEDTGAGRERTAAVHELRRDPSPLALAALAAVAVPGLDPVRLTLPQEESPALRVVGVIDTQGRHWEVLQARTDEEWDLLESEAGVLRRIGRAVDAGRASFDVARPAGSLHQDGVRIQVRSHVEGRPVDAAALHPGPGLSAGLGRALGELHELSTSVISEAGMPVYDADDVRDRWLAVLDDAAATGKVPSALLSRWEQALEDTALWRFKPTVVHGDLAEENILTAGGAVVAVRGLNQAHVGDPAEDMAWIYSTAPVDCLESIESAYDTARSEGVDKHLRDRAELVSEMSLARWLLHGIDSGRQEVIDDAVSMLADLAEQVGREPLVAPHSPRLAPVPGERRRSGPRAVTREVDMMPVEDEDDDPFPVPPPFPFPLRLAPRPIDSPDGA